MSEWPLARCYGCQEFFEGVSRYCPFCVGEPGEGAKKFTEKTETVRPEYRRMQETMSFGKHKGTALKDLTGSYIGWLLSQRWLKRRLRKSLQNENLRRLSKKHAVPK